MIAGNLWNALLDIKKEVEQYTDIVRYCTFSENGVVKINERLTPKNSEWQATIFIDTPTTEHHTGALFQLSPQQDLQVIQVGLFDSNQINFLQTYLPLCFLSVLAKKYKRTISVAHFAQTLDGKIATHNGDSKWIGNRENLIHAHRMRALCDGILIGNRTLAADQPKLTVRHVSGQNPKRIVLGTSHTDFSSLTNNGSEKIIVIGSPCHNWNGCLDYVQLNKVDGIIPPRTILEKLYQKKINSIYIEGGASTTSCFLNQKAVDILQLHIAPMLFGSGKSGITLPVINEVKQAIQFKDYQFHKIGSEIMFTGFLNKNNGKDD